MFAQRQAYYQLLDAAGIRYWLSRHNEETLFKSRTPLFCATCLVILPNAPSALSVKEEKMLSGMLEVLSLDHSQLCVAWMGDSEPTPQALQDELLKWAPQTVLLLGKAHFTPLFEKKIPETVQLTYHPTELQAEPSRRSQAYQALLSLKKQIASLQIL